MNKLINSAMMPSLDHTYICRSCTAEEFAKILRSEPFESFIGYPETARILEEFAGVSIKLNRVQTIVKYGDTLLIMRLKYRLQDPAQKGNTIHKLEDFEFGICRVS